MDNREVERSYYAVIPANVRYDDDIPANAKLLYGEITALCSDRGYCWAGNTYFAELYKVSKVTVSRWVKSLIDKGYITISFAYKEGKNEIESRIIHLAFNTSSFYPEGINKNDNRVLTKMITGINKNVKENNTCEYIHEFTKVNSCIREKETKIQKLFIPPKVEEVAEYCEERQNGINAQYFVDYYQSKGWYVGKSKMKDWKASVRTWEQNCKKEEKPQIEQKYHYE